MTNRHRVDGALYRQLPRGQLGHMEARKIEDCDVTPQVQSLLARSCRSFVRWRCPNCGKVVAEVCGHPTGPLVGIAYEKGPEPWVRSGLARAVGLQGPEKAPDINLALFWVVDDLPDRWQLRCEGCGARSDVDSNSISQDVEAARTSRNTMTRGARRLR